jgi:hypothetical protein
MRLRKLLEHCGARPFRVAASASGCARRRRSGVAAFWLSLTFWSHQCDCVAMGPSYLRRWRFMKTQNARWDAKHGVRIFGLCVSRVQHKRSILTDRHRGSFVMGESDDDGADAHLRLCSPGSSRRKHSVVESIRTPTLRMERYLLLHLFPHHQRHRK